MVLDTVGDNSLGLRSRQERKLVKARSLCCRKTFQITSEDVDAIQRLNKIRMAVNVEDDHVQCPREERQS